MNPYVGLFILVVVGVLLAILITGTISTRKLHLGIPDQ